jgi:hypothetical protein
MKWDGVQCLFGLIIPNGLLGLCLNLKLKAMLHVGVPISLWLFLFPIFLFAAQPKEFFLDGLKKLEQRMS